MSSYKKDILSGLVFLMLGIAVLICVPLTIQDPQLSSVGPRFFPEFHRLEHGGHQHCADYPDSAQAKKAGLPADAF